jgi:hypothetical protein
MLTEMITALCPNDADDGDAGRQTPLLRHSPSQRGEDRFLPREERGRSRQT